MADARKGIGPLDERHVARPLHDHEFGTLDALVDFLRVVGVDDQVAIRTGDERGNLYLVKPLERVSLQAGAQLPLPAQVDA